MTIPPPNQVALARKYGQLYGVDPRVLLAIGGHETQWGTTGAGRPSQGGFALGYGVTDSGILGKYHGLQNQYRYAAKTLADWGVHGIKDIMAGKAARYASDPNWEKGVNSVYGGMAGGLPANVAGPPAVPPQTVAPKPPPRAAVAPTPRFKTVTQRVYDPSNLARGIFSSLAQGEIPNTSGLVSQSFKNVTTKVPLPPGVKRTALVVTPLPKGQDDKTPPSAMGQHIVQMAAKQLGQKYVWGGESRAEGGFDCSGLVDYALRAAGVKLPFRVTTVTALKLGHSVKGQALKAGDMIVCNGGKHMVLYAGNGKVIAAPHTGTDVQYQPLSTFGSIVDIRRL